LVGKGCNIGKKFTTFCQEPSPCPNDGNVHELLQKGESILQMLQRIKVKSMPKQNMTIILNISKNSIVYFEAVLRQV